MKTKIPSRKFYLDNIRSITVLLVLIYHVFYIFNGVGTPGGIPNAPNIPFCDSLAALVYPWFMVLLFVISGISARYSLQKRTIRQFLKERAVKLLIPSTLGLFVLQWVTGWWNIRLGGGLEYIPGFLIYPISAISGTGPLWFIQMLFLFSCLVALLKAIDRSDRLWKSCEKAGPLAALLFLPIWGAAQLLNMPLLTMYRFGIYFAAFLFGYYIFSQQTVETALERLRIPTLILALTSGALYLQRWHGQDYTSPDCLQSLLTNFYLWMALLAILSWGKRYLDHETPLTQHTGLNFGLYLLHYPVLITAAALLCLYAQLPAAANYLIVLAAELVITPLLYWGITKVPVLRLLILGTKKPKAQ